jgi:chromosome segregation ATPase
VILDDLADRIEAEFRRLGLALLVGRTPPGPDGVSSFTPRQLAQLRDELGKAGSNGETRRQHLSELSAQAALLPSEIENGLERGKSAQAFRLALELDRLRSEIRKEEESLAELQSACDELDRLIREAERRPEKPEQRG